MKNITTGQAGSAWKLFHFLHELKLCVHWNFSVLLSSKTAYLRNIETCDRLFLIENEHLLP